MEKFKILKVLLFLFICAEACFAADIELGFFSVKDSLLDSSVKTKTLLKKVIPKVIRFKGGAGAILFKDKYSGLELIATARHLETKDSTTVPSQDSYWVVHNPKANKTDFTYGEFGHGAIENSISADAKAGDFAIALGFPNQYEMSYSTGKILSDAEVRRLQKQQGINQSAELAYDPSIERFLEARGYQGMSGGPVFNSSGQWIGTSVRAGEFLRPKPDDWKQGVVYIRFLTASHMLSTFKQELADADQEQRKHFGRFTRSIENLVNQSACWRFY